MLDGFCPLYSKVKLGCDYEVDFAWLESLTPSEIPDWRLVEIESPKAKLFTKAGDPAADLTHAIQQVRDWLDWIHAHLDYAQKLMPSIKYPNCFIFIGRRADLTSAAMQKLQRLKFEQRGTVQVHTLDWFVDAAKGVLSRVKSGDEWRVPMKALSHAELASGLASSAQAYLEMRSRWERGGSTTEAPN